MLSPRDLRNDDCPETWAALCGSGEFFGTEGERSAFEEGEDFVRRQGDVGSGGFVCENFLGDEAIGGTEDLEVIGGWDFDEGDQRVRGIFLHELEGVGVAPGTFDDEGGRFDGGEPEGRGAEHHFLVVMRVAGDEVGSVLSDGGGGTKGEDCSEAV